MQPARLVAATANLLTIHDQAPLVHHALAVVCQLSSGLLDVAYLVLCTHKEGARCWGVGMTMSSHTQIPHNPNPTSQCPAEW